MSGNWDDDDRPITGWRLGLVIAIAFATLVAGVLWGGS